MPATVVNLNGVNELDLNLAGTVTATTAAGVTTINQTGVASVLLETNGTPNGSQTTLNLTNDTGISITDAGAGVVKIKNVSVGGVGVSIYGTTVPNTGLLGFIQMPYSCTITSWTIITNSSSGSAQFDIKKSNYATYPTTTSIVASAPPAVTTSQTATSSTLTGWTTTVTAGDVIEFYLTSVSTATILSLVLDVTRT
jgi:hypothetical protein